MNEDIPPFAPNPPDTTQPPAFPKPPNFWLMFALGIVLVIVSCVVCNAFGSPFPLAVGVLIAVVSLFFRGYRGVFVGAAATIGVCLLGLIILCGSIHPQM